MILDRGVAEFRAFLASKIFRPGFQLQAFAIDCRTALLAQFVSGRRSRYLFLRAYNCSMALASSIKDDQTELVRVLNEYYSAFSTLKVEAVLPYFHEPSLLIGPQGPFAATTHALLATAFTPAMEGLRARGFGRTELRVRTLKSLSATAALVGGVAQRYKIDGQELDQAGVTYALHKGEAGWKIAAIIIHDPDEGG
jgi:hypothetical protein